MAGIRPYRRKVRRSRVSPGAASSGEPDISDFTSVTSTPASSPQSGIATKFAGATSTEDPGDGEESAGAEVGSYAALIERYILRPNSVPFFILVFVVLGFVLIQDNGSGNLQNWAGIYWSIQKCLVIVALFGAIFVVKWLLDRLSP